jgi:hypothetical protein
MHARITSMNSFGSAFSIRSSRFTERRCERFELSIGFALSAKKNPDLFRPHI